MQKPSKNFSKGDHEMTRISSRRNAKLGFPPLFTIALLIGTQILLARPGQSQSNNKFELVPTIAFSSVRDNPDCLASFPPNNQPAIAEVYLMAPDGRVQQLTDNNDCTHADLFPALSGDGKKIIFDSNR